MMKLRELTTSATQQLQASFRNKCARIQLLLDDGNYDAKYPTIPYKMLHSFSYNI
jgi:hypothetical protein